MLCMYYTALYFQAIVHGITLHSDIVRH